jgi:hypothetical protein
MNSREEVQERRGRVKHRVIRSRPTHPSLIKAIECRYCHEDDVYELAQRSRDDPAVAHHFCSVERRARRRREDGGRGFFRSTRFGHPQRHISCSLASLQLLLELICGRGCPVLAHQERSVPAPTMTLLHASAVLCDALVSSGF